MRREPIRVSGYYNAAAASGIASGRGDHGGRFRLLGNDDLVHRDREVLFERHQADSTSRAGLDHIPTSLRRSKRLSRRCQPAQDDQAGDCHSTPNREPDPLHVFEVHIYFLSNLLLMRADYFVESLCA
jgi:hypothetical protein